MNTRLYKLSLYCMALTGLLFFIISAQSARAETTNCTAITTIPTVISTQGIYCFSGHLATSMTSGNAIDIQVNNVTIDMNGYKLGGLGAGDGTEAYGVYANQRKNITVRNGIIRGFQTGIYLDDVTPYTTSQGHLIEDIVLDQNTWGGIFVAGRGITIQRNHILDSGESTVPSLDFAFGIYIIGPGHRVLNNNITTVKALSGSNDSAVGLVIFVSVDSIIQNNRIANINADGTGSSYGVALQETGHTTVYENVITRADAGIVYFASSGVYKDNTTDNIAVTKYSGGTDGGDNY